MFIDLRDRYGITQCIIQNGGDTKEVYERAQKIGREFVLQITGNVKSRGKDANKNRATGEIEIDVTDVRILNSSKTPPFLIENKTDAKEDTRLKFRYLDLRRNKMKESLLLRNRVTIMVRKSLNEKEFCEVETPVLIKSTPEGARDFVVPSRTYPGNFFALPQSPQTFKQLLMVAGLDRYFQIVKCFRDEDLRNDRQPEFTQIDCEMSFVEQKDVLTTFERMMADIFSEVVGHKFPLPFPRLTYEEAMKTYGIDKPDLRYDMKLVDLTKLTQGKSDSFKLFDSAEIVLGIRIPGDKLDYESKSWQNVLKKTKDDDKKQTIEWLKDLTEKQLKKCNKDIQGSYVVFVLDFETRRVSFHSITLSHTNRNTHSNIHRYVRKWSKKVLKQMDKLCKGQDVAAKALFWVKVPEQAGKPLDSSVKKNFSQEVMQTWVKEVGAQPGDCVFIFAGKTHHTRECMGKLRHIMGMEKCFFSFFPDSLLSQTNIVQVQDSD